MIAELLNRLRATPEIECLSHPRPTMKGRMQFRFVHGSVLYFHITGVAGFATQKLLEDVVVKEDHFSMDRGLVVFRFIKGEK